MSAPFGWLWQHGGGGRHKPRKRRSGEAIVREPFDEIARGCRADAGVQLKRPEPGDRIARVLRPAQDCEHVLDVSRFEKFEPTIFDERDVAPAKLDFEKIAVMSGAEQHGLPFERDARLPVLEDMVGDIGRLRRLIFGADEAREFG